MSAELAILFDVDNTLLDNDRVQADLRAHMTEEYGREASERYWTLLEELRVSKGYIDYLGALQLYRVEAMHNPRVLRMADWMADYDFASCVYPGAFDAVRRAQSFGLAAILSDGDAAFQPRKVERSGLWSLFRDNVLIYVHKEEELDDVARWYPADHYVLVDDKLRILDAVKERWGERITTVFVQQGHYAREPGLLERYREADLTIACIADFNDVERAALLG
ncbi:MAG: HAD family hydrolase [Acetobacteraceae bacterium]|nr:HAD family hydrolase [Acetobacteraceae bacterium]